ncbi:MAG: hypothetical protein A3K57_04570 [Caulobacterales bacterium RIFOXYA1_FULL_67_7]|nr:MAG: hypothetical protein A3K57_04570 [Caulobacterales bacterium RIFOXYA1_FULL_67_7]
MFLASTAAVLAAGLATTPAAAQAASGASAQGRAITIPAQPLGAAVQALSEQTDAVVIAAGVRLNGRRSAAVSGAGTVEQALTTLLRGTGLGWRRDVNGAYVIAPAADEPVRRRQTTAPAALSAPQQARPDVAALEDIVVTARRMEERIIDVPVAVSAFSAEQLDERKIEGGAELLRVVPNVNFSKDNFTGYNFSIRGIGAKVLATTADPGVAVSFNNTALLRNRLFEQEYFDVQRLEVLRGPQGTLYGRNATAGVVNLLPNLPELEQFSMDAQWEVGNHDSRRARGMINIPVGDTLAVRGAFAVTQRDGFDYNTVTDQNVNGRDLWSTRVGVLWEPTENFRANFLWERFREDDDRARTGKMLCTRGETPESLAWTAPDGTQRQATEIVIEDMLVLDSRRQGEDVVFDDQAGQAVGAVPAAQPVQAAPADEVAPEVMAEEPQAATTKPIKSRPKSKSKKEEEKVEETAEEVAEDIPF